MIGPPGTGKTLLAKRLPTILPPLTPAESLETTRIYSVMGLLRPGQPLMAVRPFRPPHHPVAAGPHALQAQARGREHPQGRHGRAGNPALSCLHDNTHRGPK